MKILVTFLFIIHSLAFPEINNENEVFAYYEQYSFTPLLHVYFDKHFHKSKQFEAFEVVLNELQNDIQDYSQIVFTDCDQNTDGYLQTCNIMKQTQNNRDVIGTVPSSDFKSFGNVVIQSPPENRVLRHQSDVYTKQQLLVFIEGLLPNFYKSIHNQEEYQQLLVPHYVPKLILLNREDEEVPMIMKKLSVHFNLKFDFALIDDLTDDLIPQVFNVKKFPKMIVLVYDYEAQQYVHHEYSGDLNLNSYYKVKKYLQQYALTSPRNDIIFHKIKIQDSVQIQYAQTPGQLQKILQQSNGWSFIQKTTQSRPNKLIQFKQKYDRYFQYIHYIKQAQQTQQDNQFTLYNPSYKQSYPLIQDKLQFSQLSAEHFETNMTVWLAKDFVVMGVRKQYSHLCSISEKHLFRTHVRCFIIQEQGYDKLAQTINAEFEIAFVSYTRYDEEVKKVVTKGSPIKAADYDTVYYSLQYSTRVKLKQILDNFIDNPISQVLVDTLLIEYCSHPTKKCFMLFTDLSKKDRTMQEYIKEIAINYLQGYIFVEVDTNSNKDLVEYMQVKGKQNLVVYYPKTREYVRLDKKITKGLIQKFLKANLQNDKRLKKFKIDNNQLMINRYDNEENDEL